MGGATQLHKLSTILFFKKECVMLSDQRVHRNRNQDLSFGLTISIGYQAWKASSFEFTDR